MLELPHYQRLEQEITSYIKMARLTDEELMARNDLIERVQNAISEVISANISIYGSYASGMATYNSDIDLGVSSEHTIDYECLRKITNILNRRIGRCEYIEAKVPIIKGVDSTTLIEFDLSFQGHQQVRNDISIALGAPEDAKELCIVLKEFLKQRGLNTPHTGGISGHILLHMVLAYFQSRDQLFPYPLRREIKHATQLLEFFETYGILFNSIKCYIRADGKNVNFYPKTDMAYQIASPKSLISILVAQVGQTGSDKYKDISSGVYNWRLLRHSFEANFYRLQYKSEQGESILQRIIMLDSAGLLTRDKSIILSRSISRSIATSAGKSISNMTDYGILDISDDEEDPKGTVLSLEANEPPSPDVSEIPKVYVERKKSSFQEKTQQDHRVSFADEILSIKNNNIKDLKSSQSSDQNSRAESKQKEVQVDKRQNLFMKQYMQNMEASRSNEDNKQ